MKAKIDEHETLVITPESMAEYLALKYISGGDTADICDTCQRLNVCMKFESFDEKLNKELSK